MLEIVPEFDLSKKIKKRTQPDYFAKFFVDL